DHVGGELPNVVCQSLAALLNCMTIPRVYQRGPQLVITERLDKEIADGKIVRPARSLVITTIKPERMVRLLTQAARFRRRDERSGKMRSINAPALVARILLDSSDLWSFAPLNVITETPTLRPDGSALDQPGYDDATGILLDTNGVDFGCVPKTPSRD